MNLLKNEYASYFELYISKAQKNNTTILDSLEFSNKYFFQLLSDLPNDKHLYAYAKNKWTIKELVSHIIDTERIMTYRALRISRNDKSNLLPFDENEFVKNSNANAISFSALLNEFSLVRQSTITMYQSFNKEQLLRIGKASDVNLSVRALGFILSGHVIHHLQIIEDRYL